MKRNKTAVTTNDISKVDLVLAHRDCRGIRAVKQTCLLWQWRQY